MGCYSDLMGIHVIYPLVICNIAIETMAIEIVNFPNSMVIFHSYGTVYQRVVISWFINPKKIIVIYNWLYRPAER